MSCESPILFGRTTALSVCPRVTLEQIPDTGFEIVDLGEHHKQTALTRKLISLPSFPPTTLSSWFSFSQCFPTLSSCFCFSRTAACVKQTCSCQTISPRLHLTSAFTHRREAFTCFNTSDTTSFLLAEFLPKRRFCSTELKSSIWTWEQDVDVSSVPFESLYLMLPHTQTLPFTQRCWWSSCFSMMTVFILWYWKKSSSTFRGFIYWNFQNFFEIFFIWKKDSSFTSLCCWDEFVLIDHLSNSEFLVYFSRF